jgi:putative two-component system response regulator
MIVDDSLSNVLLLEKMLENYGYTQIITLTDSREAITLYNNYHPDLVLLDLEMPYWDGFKVLEQLNLNKNDDYLPIIVVTAQSNKESKLKALEMGAKDFIGKPYENTELLVKIRNMLEMRMLHNKIVDQNLKLEEKVQERTKELENIQVELIDRLVIASEYRDNDTGDHIKRIGLYAYELAKIIGLSENDSKLIEKASKMHDIGKIGIPDDILLKPGKLTPDEWEIMMSHSVKGGKIISGSKYELLKIAEQITLTHHEKWDGNGYPNKLKGEEIPLAGRITAICDVFDALLSKRPYKEAWDIKETIYEIQKGRGTHFDPELVDAFLSNLSIFLNIREKFN